MTATMENLTSSQRALVNEILERENPQRKVDEIVRETKLKINSAAISDGIAKA